MPLISSKVIERELVEALRARKAVLEERLDEKRKSLAAVCFQEAVGVFANVICRVSLERSKVDILNYLLSLFSDSGLSNILKV